MILPWGVPFSNGIVSEIAPWYFRLALRSVKNYLIQERSFPFTLRFARLFKIAVGLASSKAFSKSKNTITAGLEPGPMSERILANASSVPGYFLKPNADLFRGWATCLKRLSIIISGILAKHGSKELGRNWSGLFGFGMAQSLAVFQSVGSLDELKIRLNKFRIRDLNTSTIRGEGALKAPPPL